MSAEGFRHADQIQIADGSPLALALERARVVRELDAWAERTGGEWSSDARAECCRLNPRSVHSRTFDGATPDAARDAAAKGVAQSLPFPGGEVPMPVFQDAVPGMRPVDAPGRYHIKTPVPPSDTSDDLEIIRKALYAGQVSAAKVDAQRAFERLLSALEHKDTAVAGVTPCDSHEICYRVRNRDRIRELVGGLPAGWRLVRLEPFPIQAPEFITGSHWLVFEVQGERSNRDDDAVLALIGRLGMQ